jgi:hypothetical protein
MIPAAPSGAAFFFRLSSNAKEDRQSPFILVRHPY